MGFDNEGAEYRRNWQEAAPEGDAEMKPTKAQQEQRKGEALGN